MVHPGQRTARAGRQKVYTKGGRTRFQISHGQQKRQQRKIQNVKADTGSSQSPQTKSIGRDVHILQINVEGLTRDKCDYLSKLAHEHDIDVLALQETHLGDGDAAAKCKIPGYKAISMLLSPIHGSTVYVKNNITDYTEVTCQEINDIEVIMIALKGLTITTVYKPPIVKWPTPALPTAAKPCVYVGDFNSHHTTWGYTNTDENGEKLSEWIDAQELYLSYDAKEIKTFRSGRWQTETNPDLTIVSTDENKLPLDHTRKVLKHFPRSQHRPTKISIGVEIPVIKFINKPRWNFKKANWTQYTQEVESNLRWIPPKAENYKRFVGILIGAAKRNIPRGVRKYYVPGWDESTQTLYKEYQKTGDAETGKQILEELNEGRKEKWKELTSQLNFTHSSRKAWTLLRKMGTATYNCNPE